ncbi:MAG: tRNA (guanosine(37)-N1)-methyltransferase TrmD, partial [Acholeplasmataceae bacterium]|nr:tRNA (guanosine(37)-N1)-methyltransferase TrmD [Acholeplasmataceae bacterium]
QNGWLKYPQYTKPEEYKGFKVPEVLVSGNHQLIDQWRTKQQIKKTLNKRPDLVNQIEKTEKEVQLLKEFNKNKK